MSPKWYQYKNKDANPIYFSRCLALSLKKIIPHHHLKMTSFITITYYVHRILNREKITLASADRHSPVAFYYYATRSFWVQSKGVHRRRTENIYSDQIFPTIQHAQYVTHCSKSITKYVDDFFWVKFTEFCRHAGLKQTIFRFCHDYWV